MQFKSPGGKIKKSVLGAMLSLAVFAQTTPITTAQQEQQLIDADEQLFQQLQSEAEAQLMMVYNQSGGSPEAVFARAAEMINDAAFESLDLEPIVFEGGEGGGSTFDFPDASGEAGDTTWQRQQQCRYARLDNCRRQFNAELLASMATSVAIAAGCLALTGGTQFVLCIAAAVAAHALQIAAAKQRYAGCKALAYYDCRYV